jgi:hypothetical protein
MNCSEIASRFIAPIALALADIARFYSITSSARFAESGLAPCHDTQFIAAKVSTTLRLLNLIMPMPG